MHRFQAVLATAVTLGLATAGHSAEIITPSSVPIDQMVVTLAGGTDAIIGSNKGRRYLCLMNIGTDLVSLAFDRPALAGAGWALEGATLNGHQGGSMCWEGATVAGSVVHAISAAGSTVAVLEGR